MIKRIVRWISNLLLILLALLVLFHVALAIKRATTSDPCPTVLGIATAVVISGSMEPELSVNDVVVIWEQDDYGVGDVITFRDNGNAVTHRIIAEREEEGTEYYITKGDANNAEDDEINKSAVIGKVVLTLSGLGSVYAFVRTPIGFLLVTLIAGAFLLLPELFRKKDEK